MKTKSKALLLALCAVLLVAASVLGTLAYLTSQDQVTNTFSVGSVSMTLDEKDVKPDGTNDTENEDNDTLNTLGRVQANEYHLLPGHKYIKDPIIHIAENSESCWVFVKVENGIDTYEAETTTGENAYTDIAGQIAANGWMPLDLDDVANVYYKEYSKGQDDKNLEVFQEFKIADNAETVAGWSDITPETTKINVFGYAVQKDGFDTAAAAWTAAFAQD